MNHMRNTGKHKMVRICKGSLYLENNLYETYFNGLSTAVLLMRDKQIVLLPVHHEAGGGLLMKIRNAQGDRVIHAQEFFTEHYLDELETELPAVWDNELAGLKLGIQIK